MGRKIGWVVAGLLASSLAWAQQPLQFNIGPRGPVRYAVEEVASVRFLGEEVPGPTLSAGEQVELITEKDGWVRVKKGERYGWVPAGKLVEEPPAEDPPSEE